MNPNRKKLDLTTWERRPHFEFFNSFEEPYYDICVRMDCTSAYRYAKAKNVSYFLYCVYQSLTAAQKIKEFRYRIDQGDVYLYETVDAGSVIDRSNGTFGYGYYPYHESLEDFLVTAAEEFASVRIRNDVVRKPISNIIRFSSLPWIDFTSLSHARMFSAHDSCPSITFGKMVEQDGKRTMPVSIHVHHALIDGLHVGQYLDALQSCLNSR